MILLSGNAANGKTPSLGNVDDPGNVDDVFGE
jgi:hypothetical protein